MRKRTVGWMHRAIWIGAAACALWGLPAAAAPLYSFTALGIASASSTYGRAINNAGQVAGSADTANGSDAALWSGGTGTLLSRPEGVIAATGHAINASGQVAGSVALGMGRYMNRGAVWGGGAVSIIDSMESVGGINAGGQLAGYGPARSFYAGPLSWSAGVTTELGASGGLTGQAFDVNDAGQVVGFNGNAFEEPRATLWSDGDVIDLGVAGIASAINNAGQIVGTSSGAAASRAFQWSALGLTWLGDGAAAASGINEAGQIVGGADFGGISSAALWSDGAWLDLNTLVAPGSLEPGWVLRGAHDINDNGWIVGDAYNAQTGLTTAFLLTPQDANAVPEPPSAALVLLALGALYRLRRRA